jgi:hypothetical protein
MKEREDQLYLTVFLEKLVERRRRKSGNEATEAPERG